jgi:hypothetical protein
MQSKWTINEITLILKSMFILLSNNFRISDEDESFLNEVASMGLDFQLIDYKGQIENWKNEYNSNPNLFLKTFLDELSETKVDNRTKQVLLSFSCGIIEQSEKTYHRLMIIKCIRAKINIGESEIPKDYKQYKEIPLPLDTICQFLERGIIDDTTLFTISNEHNIQPMDKLTVTNNTMPKAGRKWWQKLFSSK